MLYKVTGLEMTNFTWFYNKGIIWSSETKQATPFPTTPHPNATAKHTTLCPTQDHSPILVAPF